MNLTAANLVALVLAVHLAVAVEGAGNTLVTGGALPLVVPAQVHILYQHVVYTGHRSRTPTRCGCPVHRQVLLRNDTCGANFKFLERLQLLFTFSLKLVCMYS